MQTIFANGSLRLAPSTVFSARTACCVCGGRMFLAPLSMTETDWQTLDALGGPMSTSIDDNSAHNRCHKLWSDRAIANNPVAQEQLARWAKNRKAV